MSPLIYLTLLIIFVFTLFIYLFYCIWRRSKVGKIGISLFIALLVYLIVTAIYPSSSFYKDEFNRVSGLEFPSSGKFIFKSSSYPDFHGDYGSCSVFTVSETDLSLLKKHTVPQSATTSSFSCGGFGSKDAPLYVTSFGKSKRSRVDEEAFWGITKEGYVVVNYYSW